MRPFIHIPAKPLAGINARLLAESAKDDFADREKIFAETLEPLRLDSEVWDYELEMKGRQRFLRRCKPVPLPDGEWVHLQECYEIKPPTL